MTFSTKIVSVGLMATGTIALEPSPPIINKGMIQQGKAQLIDTMLGALEVDQAYPHSEAMREAARDIKNAVNNVQRIFDTNPEGPFSETLSSNRTEISTNRQQGLQAIQQARGLIEKEGNIFQGRSGKDRYVEKYLKKAEEYLAMFE